MRILFFLLMFLGAYSFAQKSVPKFIVKMPSEKNYFYGEQANVMFISINQSNDAYNEYIFNKLKSLPQVKNVENKTKEDIKYFSVEFTQPLNVESAKTFFQSMNIKCFYTALMKKVYVEDLLTEEEILSRKNATIQYFQANEKCGDPQYIEYYNFNIFNVEAKMQSMYNNDYIKNLFNGNVGELRDRYNKAIQERSEFVKNINK